MDFSHLRIDLSKLGIAYLYLRKPEQHNAFDEHLIQELLLALTYLQKMPELRVLVLGAEGASFCAGADLYWMQRMAQFNLDENLTDANHLAQLLEKLAHFPLPTIAMVQGSAYGGGVGLVAACDMAIASEAACFCLSEVKLGLIPAVISPYLIKSIGFKATKRYALSAQTFSAKQAQTLGLIDEVVMATELAATVDKLAENLLANSPQALIQIKQLLWQIHDKPYNAELRHETVEAIAHIRVSPEGQAGVKAFLEHKPKPWLPDSSK